MKRRQRGLTLIELMVTLAVAITLLAIGIPAFQGIEANNRAAAQANAFVSALNLARTEAVSRGFSVVVCPSGDGSSCAGSGTWGSGLLVFADEDGSDTPAAAEIVRSFDAPSGKPVVAAVPGTLALVRFNGRGERSTTPPLTETRVKFQLSQTGSAQVRCVCVHLSGQVMTERAACTPDPLLCP